MMQHDWNDQVEAKFMGALPLLRIMSGSDLNPQVEQRWMEVALHQIGRRACVHALRQGRPWTLCSGSSPMTSPPRTRSRVSFRLQRALARSHRLLRPA